MMKSSSKSSLGKKTFHQKYFNDHNKQLMIKVQTVLQQASIQLSHSQFYSYYLNIISSLIYKFDAENIDSSNIQILKKIVNKYNPNLYLSVKLIFLQVKSQLYVFPQQNLALLNKTKHMIIDTEFQYLLPKVFLLQAKIYQILNQRDLQTKCLLKSIDFSENFVLEYLNDKQNIRKQIVQNIVIVYFELYKLKRQQNHKQAEQYLRRAYRATQKNYGQESEVKQILNLMLNEHKNISRSLQKTNYSIKTPLKAFTEIVLFQIQKDTRIYGFYLWQDQKIVVQMLKINYEEEIIVYQTEYSIKLDMNKINLLKNTQWLKITQNQIVILEDQILKAFGLKQQHTATTRVEIKNISRQQIIKKDSLSSSSQDPSFIQKEDFNFIRNLGRAQSAKRNLNI